MSALFQFLASVPRGFADLLALELADFGALDLRERGNVVAFTGTLEVAYRACLESRVASRVYLELRRFEADTDAQIYAALRQVDWAQHVDPRGTLACEWSGRHPAIGNTHFGTLRLKDAICDALREVSGLRPDIATAEPSVRVHAHAVGTRVTVSIDLAGEGLHRRGWRTDAGEAPLRENVAAGLLVRAGWPALARRGGAFLDPMCGAGTLVVEAARIAGDVAANLDRQYYGFLRWRGHDAATWQAVLEAARQRAADGRARDAVPLLGRDRDPRAIRMANENAARAGVADRCRFEVGELDSAEPPATTRALEPPLGLLCCNPPYGVRLGDPSQARAGHELLGRVLRERFRGWNAAILTGSPELGLELGLRASRVHTVWNGAIECRLLRIEVSAAAERDLRPRRESAIDVGLAASPGATMFANRLAKNQRTLAAWLKRESPGCYRLYDADMPEYSFAVDLYAGEAEQARWLYVQEYLAPREIPEDAVRRRRSEALSALPAATGIPIERIHLRTRKRNARGEQYAKLGEERRFEIVVEQGLRFQVNFTDYLDTGLFLDHRLTRARLRDAARGVRFLNLFGYTGTATVYAAAGGARSTTTVDLSRTYLDWARHNLSLNGLDGAAHRVVQADAREWLPQARAQGERFELVFCDPPTFSNSKRMDGVFDVQRDHAALIDACLGVLAPGGLLLFSTNAQKFTLDPGLGARAQVKDISRATLPPDFARNPRIHQAFEIRAMPAHG